MRRRTAAAAWRGREHPRRGRVTSRATFTRVLKESSWLRYYERCCRSNGVVAVVAAAANTTATVAWRRQEQTRYSVLLFTAATRQRVRVSKRLRAVIGLTSIDRVNELCILIYLPARCAQARMMGRR